MEYFCCATNSINEKSVSSIDFSLYVWLWTWLILRIIWLNAIPPFDLKWIKLEKCLVMLIGWPLHRLFKHPTFVALIVLFIGICLVSWNIYTLKAIARMLTEEKYYLSARQYSESCSSLNQPKHSTESRKLVAWINGKNKGSTTYLRHVRRMFSALGYAILDGDEGMEEQDSWVDFDVLWNHEYPFSVPHLRRHIDGASASQLINHVPGSGYYTSKVQLAMLGLNRTFGGIPMSFQLPRDADAFRRFSQLNPNIMWVQKSNAHRGINVLPVDELQLDSDGTFIQQFVDNPLLIDERKFDIGIYTVITSVSPLRVYIYDADILLRFCSVPYRPFDAKNLDQYVIGDDYTPLWEIPSLRRYHVEQNLSFKESFSAYIQRKYGLNADDVVYGKIRRIIRQVFQLQNEKMRKSLAAFKNKQIFFELSRFDFIVDENFNVFLMEANMSPNLSSGHFAPNKFLYEKLLLNIFTLLGVSSRLSLLNAKPLSDDFKALVSDGELMSYSALCDEKHCDHDIQGSPLCAKCMTPELEQVLQRTYLEQFNKRSMRRIVPHLEDVEEEGSSTVWMTQLDKLLNTWLKIKCQQSQNPVFC